MTIRGAATAVLVMWMAVSGARAEDGFGLGVILGEPTGVSMKKWISQEHAIDAAVAWSFGENDSVQFHADYLVHFFELLHVDPAAGRLPLYVGLGGRVKLSDHDNRHARNEHDALIGLRVPFGMSFLFAKVPVDLFAEIVPILDVSPGTDVDLNGAIGARFYFR